MRKVRKNLEMKYINNISKDLGSKLKGKMGRHMKSDKRIRERFLSLAQRKFFSFTYFFLVIFACFMLWKAIK